MRNLLLKSWVGEALTQDQMSNLEQNNRHYRHLLNTRHWLDGCPTRATAVRGYLLRNEARLDQQRLTPHAIFTSRPMKLLTTPPEVTPTQKWSGTLPLPPIGGRVLTRCNGFGTATVTGYFVDGSDAHAWIGVVVTPDRLPSFVLSRPTVQLEENLTGGFHFFGAEVAASDVPPPPLNARHEIALALLKRRYRNWKETLAELWETGTYSRFNVGDIDSLLQQIRNAPTGRKFAFGRTRKRK